MATGYALVTNTGELHIYENGNNNPIHTFDLSHAHDTRDLYKEAQQVLKNQGYKFNPSWKIGNNGSTCNLK